MIPIGLEDIINKVLELLRVVFNTFYLKCNYTDENNITNVHHSITKAVNKILTSKIIKL